MYTAESYRYLLMEDLKRFCFKHNLMVTASLSEWKQLSSYIKPEIYGESVLNSKLSDTQILEIVRHALLYSGNHNPSRSILEEYSNALNSYCTQRIVVRGD